MVVPYGKISGVSDIGAIVRARRREKGLRQDAASGIAGVGIRFVSELERGKPTVQLEKALRVLHRLGLEVWIVPRGSGAHWSRDER